VNATAAQEALPVRISVVIPAWRDGESLAALVPTLAQLPRVHQIVIVDASADAATEELALKHGAILLKCSAPNRGAQMNVGAMFASGDVVLFQHADTDLTDAHLAAIQSALGDEEVIGGAFYRKFDSRHPHLKWLEKIARFVSRNGGTMYGDQSIFARRELFLQMQGFAKIPLMEDVEFSRRVRAAGKVVLLDPPVQTSGRRHERNGAWKTTLQNGLFIVLYKCGVSPATLHRWYYQIRGPVAASGDRSLEEQRTHS
jgi:rSAM/selenodomain-associated transferase 2